MELSCKQCWFKISWAIVFNVLKCECEDHFLISNNSHKNLDQENYFTHTLFLHSFLKVQKLNTVKNWNTLKWKSLRIIKRTSPGDEKSRLFPGKPLGRAFLKWGATIKKPLFLLATVSPHLADSNAHYAVNVRTLQLLVTMMKRLWAVQMPKIAKCLGRGYNACLYNLQKSVHCLCIQLLSGQSHPVSGAVGSFWANHSSVTFPPCDWQLFPYME